MIKRLSLASAPWVFLAAVLVGLEARGHAACTQAPSSPAAYQAISEIQGEIQDLREKLRSGRLSVPSYYQAIQNLQAKSHALSGCADEKTAGVTNLSFWDPVKTRVADIPLPAKDRESPALPTKVERPVLPPSPLTPFIQRPADGDIHSLRIKDYASF